MEAKVETKRGPFTVITDSPEVMETLAWCKRGDRVHVCGKSNGGDLIWGSEVRKTHTAEKKGGT